MESSDEEDLCFVALAVALRQRRRRKRFWVHPTIERRDELGEFHRLIQELKLCDDERFSQYFHMSKNDFGQLLDRVGELLHKLRTNYRRPLSPEQRLAITLRYLATGDSYTSIAFSYRVGYFSVVLMAIFDADCKFIAVDIGSYGSISDGGILASSTIGEAFERGAFDVPPASPIDEAPQLGPIPFLVVGDEAFPLKKYLLRPYPGRGLDETQKVFNYRLSRARRIVEAAFGILVQKFRIYLRVFPLNTTNVEKIIKATIVVYNFVQKGIEGLPDEDRCNAGGDGIRNIPHFAGNRAPQEAVRLRNRLKDYFNSVEGAVPWQYDGVRRGTAH